MNLVKAQELAKDLSIEELKKYANGFNPQMMPPYIALGALQAKELTAKKMAEMQGAAQGQQTSVKEQVEQKAGLMALQAQQQQQAQQQMAQQAQSQPMPAPEGVSQPQEQPQELPMQAPMGMPAAMAQGGITRLPVQFNFEEGGIIGYPTGGQVADPVAEAQAREQQALAKLRTYGLRQRQQDPEGYAAAEQDYTQAKNAVAAIERSITGGPAGVMGKPMGEAPVAPVAPVAPAVVPPVPPIDKAPTGGLPDALQKTTVVPQAPRPVVAPQTPRPAAAPATPSAPVTGAANVAPSQDQLMAEELARRKAFGIEGEAGAGAEGRREEQRKRFEASQPSGLDDLIRVFGQAGRYKGLSGLGPAYTENEDRKRAGRAAFESQMDDQMTSIEEKRRADKLGRAAGIGTGLEKSRELSQKDREATQRNLTSVEVARIQAASANRPGETERMMAEYSRLKAKDPAAAAQYLATVSQIKTGLPGGKGTMTRNEAQDNVSNLMKDVGTSMQMKKEAAESLGQKNPKISDVIEYHVQKMMGNSGGSTGTSTLPTGVKVTKISG